MTDTATTDRAKVRFIVKEFEGDRFWVILEPVDGRNVPAVGDGFLGLDLKEGLTFERAREIAELLNENITTVSHTRFYPNTGQTKPF